MRKLDRLGWAAGLSGTAYGVRIGIRLSQADALEQVLRCLPPGWKPAVSRVVDHLYSLIVGGQGPRPGIRRLHLLYSGPMRLAREQELAPVLELLESDLQLRIAESARRRIFVHAGVVGWRGQAIVIPGKSFSGKSTLVAALVRAGAVYYSDEYAVLDLAGRVHPYPKPLSIRDENGRSVLKQTAEELGGASAGRPLPLGAVLVSKYAKGRVWRPRLASPAQGFLALLRNSVPVRSQPRRTIKTLLRAVAGAQILKGVRGEADEMVDDLLGELEVLPAGRRAGRRSAALVRSV
jgi:hypothetical protein